MWLSRFRNRIPGRRCLGQPAPKPRGRRLLLEPLEDRSLPSTFNAASVADLIADINAANTAGGSNTILLAANTWFTLTGADNSTDGGNGLPVIAAKDNLSIIGQGGDTISAVTPGGFNYDPPGGWRCLDVASGAALTLSNLNLTNFQAGGSGGAIYNQGSLVLNAVTINRAFSNSPGGGIWSSGSATLENGTVIQSCQAGGGDAAGPNGTGGNAYGGGIWSSGTLTVTGGVVIENNSAVGGSGAYGTSAAGGNGFGGGVYIAGGTANLTGATIHGNSAGGGEGGYIYTGGFQVDVLGPGGNGYGGGLYAANGASVTLCSDTVEYNAASGGAGAKNRNGNGYGGGLFIKYATLYLDSFTLANIINNTADHNANIDGKYALQPC
jgi:hypothetical protein